MAELDLLGPTAADGRDLLRAAARDWSQPIPHCPGWNAAELVGHMGGILAWMAQIVTTGARVSRRDREAAPADVGALASWYSAHLDRTLDILTSTDPEAATWTFSSQGDLRVGWWRRRLAVELAIHRWDAQDAVDRDGTRPPAPVTGEIAVAGIEEFLSEFLPGLLAREPIDELTGVLRLQATDGPGEWRIDLDAVTAARVAGTEPAPGGAVVRGTRSDLLLWLTNRVDAGTLEVLGSTVIGTAWTRLCR
jgi:uncharacterized protein (TIGR03083 family)